MVLLLVDLINPFDYPDAQRVRAEAGKILPEVHALAQRFRARRQPVVYVNDNFGRWRSSFDEIVEHCVERAGREIVESLRPHREDYFVLKPHRSGFYCTPLDLLLSQLATRQIVIAGITTDMCVLATASDAQIRGYETTVARDCTAAMDGERHERALVVMEQALSARLARGRDIEPEAAAAE